MGALPIPDLTRKLQAEGVRKTVVLAENVEKYTDAERVRIECRTAFAR